MDLRNRVARREDLRGMCIMDAHGHLGDHRGTPRFGEQDAKGMIKLMDEVGIKKATCSALLAVGPDFEAGNDEVNAAMQAYPGRFLGLAVIDPNYPDQIVAELDKRVAQGFSGVKIHPWCHKTYVNDPHYRILFEYADKHGLIIKSHTYCDGTFANELNRPDLFDELARTYKGATFIIGHAGGAPQGHEQAIEVGRKHDNVYVELCSTLGFTAHWLKRIVDRMGDEKILYGSDMPIYDPRAQMGIVLYAKIADSSKERILGLNTQRLFVTEKPPKKQSKAR